MQLIINLDNQNVLSRKIQLFAALLFKTVIDKYIPETKI